MYSFDVFDTLITRTTLTPRGIFALMQEKLLYGEEYAGISRHVRENFYSLRIQAEELARFQNVGRGYEEVTLQEIYEALALAGELSPEDKARLMELECETEMENSLPIESAIEKVRALMQDGEQVILLSDMYLPREKIREMLLRADAVFESVPLYVSSEFCARKTTGNLYRRAREAERCEFGDWTHFGDNLSQDIQIPGRLGIKVCWLESEPLTEYEKKLLGVFQGDAAFQRMAGYARYTRWKNRLSSRAGRIGASLCAPVLFAYVNWILEESLRKGITRLFFIARDGYLLKKVADLILKKRKLRLHTQYLYGSRKAWRMCSLTEEDFNLRELAAWSYPKRIHTTGELAELLELKTEELAPFLPYCSREEETVLSSEEVYELVAGLEKKAAFRKYYLERQFQKRELVRAYLKQEIVDGADGKERYAFVDVSGGGLTQGCLGKLMAGFGQQPIETFFFQMDRVNLAKGCKYEVFFPGMRENNLIMEMICRAPHGQTTGYVRQGDKMIPMLDEFENTEDMSCRFREMEEGVLAYTSNRLLTDEIQKFQGVLKIVEAYLVYAAQTPDRETLDYFATWPNNESGREQTFIEYAPKLTREDILNIYMRRMSWEDLSLFYKGSNLQYSLLRCNEEERSLVQRCQREYGTEWGKLARREKMLQDRAEKEKYKWAAYYPCELLEKKIVLYGAGKFGRMLYRKIQDVGKSTIIKWVDQQLRADDFEYPGEVEKVGVIREISYDQIVIAVLREELAKEIEAQLCGSGVPQEKIFWYPAKGEHPGLLSWERKVYRSDM